MKSHTVVTFLPTAKLACFKIWVVFGSYFPVNMFLVKSLPRGLFHFEAQISSFHAATIVNSKISSRSPKNKTKQEQNGDREQVSNSERTEEK